MSQDYDALGRYTEAKDKLTSVLMERDKVLRNLEALARTAQGMSLISGMVTNFNITKAQELLAKLSDLETNIVALIAELNNNAAKCGKQPITVKTINPKTKTQLNRWAFSCPLIGDYISYWMVNGMLRIDSCAVSSPLFHFISTVPGQCGLSTHP